MPRRRKTKPATPIAVLPLVGPGFRGLNTELSNADGFTEMDWASFLENTVFDDLGRVSMRKGYVDQTTTPAGTAVGMYHTHEYLRADGIVSLVAVDAAFVIWHSTDDGATWTDITGDLTGLFANLDLQFANFNGDLYIAVRGHKVHRFNDGLTNFKVISDSPVTSGSVIGTFGRLWAATDASGVVGYSGLLAGTDWTTTSSGSIDASNAWTDGQDEITAIASFGATFLIFGQRHILVYVDGAGSELGVDPDNLYVVDTIEGTGTTNRDSIINIGEGDLWFLGPQGIQSLSRVIEDKVNPLVDISKNQRSLVKSLVTNEIGAPASVKAVYSHTERFAIFTFPSTTTVLCYDLRFRLEDGTYRASTWDTLVAYNGLVDRRNFDIFFGLTGGNVAKYTGYRDNNVTIYPMTYASPWLNFGQDAHASLKILKSAYMYLWGAGTLSGTIRWAKDFRPLEFSQTYSNVFVATGAEFGSGEWGSGEFGDGLRMRKHELEISTLERDI